MTIVRGRNSLLELLRTVTCALAVVSVLSSCGARQPTPVGQLQVGQTRKTAEKILANYRHFEPVGQGHLVIYPHIEVTRFGRGSRSSNFTLDQCFGAGGGSSAGGLSAVAVYGGLVATCLVIGGLVIAAQGNGPNRNSTSKHVTKSQLAVYYDVQSKLTDAFVVTPRLPLGFPAETYLAATQNESTAQYEIGIRSIFVNRQRLWLCKAAVQGNIAAQRALASSLSEFQPVDRSLAYVWLSRAAKNFEPESADDINWAEAELRWLRGDMTRTEIDRSQQLARYGFPLSADKACKTWVSS